MAKRKEKEKDEIDRMLDGIDFHGLTAEEVTGQDGLMKRLSSRILEKMLQAEMDEHPGYAKNSNTGDNSGNSRNGYSAKTVITGDDRKLAIEVPRDREGTFTPIAVPKHETRLPLFNDQIISMYAFGMTCRDIQAHLKQVYGVEVSPELITRVTDTVMEDVKEWQSRPLEKTYPTLYLDALRVNSRQSGKTQDKALYVALAVNFEGKKEVLGLWLAEDEGAKFWMGVLTELKNRGVEDILIACMDGLAGFPDAVKAVFPDTRVQLCIVHMVRNSTRFVSYRDLKKVCADLRTVYSAPTEAAGRDSLERFNEKWKSKYPMIYKSWDAHWADLSEFYRYPEEIRRAVYTTNAIESLNFQLRKVTRNKSTFLSDDAIFKVMYLAIRNASKKWTMPIRDWGAAMNQFAIVFGKRVPML